ncbi:hypothetical protein ASG11_17820 [Sphingomonas sp. Leaf357]|uniref:spike base protein, RCAP_Rcc01079 family n=1 Tax=Sphingomonas sp. Leaf357 TaxID=1736350 RepID=UPI0006FE2AAB|nr:hypothetical protein [Sphingomonas sp. Leaf357]KQS01512.1 hypothetical protein ASG11_17820 [Sphingomonas sp. Leaf357]
MTDDFKFSNASTLAAPATSAVAITPSDSAQLDRVSRAVFIGGAGDLAVLFANDATAVTLKGLVAGSILPVRVQKILSTNTTATNIVALY